MRSFAFVALNGPGEGVRHHPNSQCRQQAFGLAAWTLNNPRSHNQQLRYVRAIPIGDFQKMTGKFYSEHRLLIKTLHNQSMLNQVIASLLVRATQIQPDVDSNSFASFPFFGSLSSVARSFERRHCLIKSYFSSFRCGSLRDDKTTNDNFNAWRIHAH